MSCNCSSSPCGCEALIIQVGPRGFTGPAGPAPSLTLDVETLAAGSPVTITQSGGAGTYDILLGIPQGATGPAGVGTPGIDGLPAFAPLDIAGLTQPAIGSQTNIATTGSFKWAASSEWVYISGGGYYKVAAPVAAPYNTMLIRNPGAADGFPAGVTGNVGAGIFIGSNGEAAQVTPGGRPGTDGTGTTGPQGPAGDPTFIGLTTTIPTLPPAPTLRTVFYTDSLSAPTLFVPYFYSGGWTAGPNIMGAPGTLWVTTAGDPNITLPAGPIGTYALRTDVVSIYLKTGATTWVLQASLTPTFAQVAVASGGAIVGETVYTDTVVGYEPFQATLAAPGTYTLDFQYEGQEIETDKDITLDWDDSNFNKYAHRVYTINNTDASPINFALTAARWYKKTGLSIPATIAAGATQMLIVEHSALGPVVTDTFVVAAA